MKIFTEIERRELQDKIEAATQQPFENPRPEFFVGDNGKNLRTVVLDSLNEDGGGVSHKHLMIYTTDVLRKKLFQYATFCLN